MLAMAVSVGVYLKADSHWLIPALLLALLGMANGLFNPANNVAMIQSVPREHMGFASGFISVMFELGNILGKSMASTILTTVFRVHTGDLFANPTPASPVAFVAAMNSTLYVAIGISLVALAISALRGIKVGQAKGT